MDVLRGVVPALSGLISRRFGCYGVFRDAREDVGVTVAEMAGAISSTIPVTSQAVSYWVLGRRVSGAARALARARALAALTHGCCP